MYLYSQFSSPFLGIFLSVAPALLSASSAFNVQGTGLRTGCPVFELQKVREAERGRGRQSARKRRPMEVR